MNNKIVNKILVVIVTHNSEKFLKWNIEPLVESNEICDVRIVDSGSKDLSYLKEIECDVEKIIYEDNIGFAKANNRALYDIDRYSSVLFLNPDARIEVENLKLLHSRLPETLEMYGIVSVPLIKYDIDKNTSENVYDSLGIICDKFGRWKDIRCDVRSINNAPVFRIDAICGAFMLISSRVLKECRTPHGNIGFDETYYMYKEDIELSLRISKKFKLKIFNDLSAYHCRGWNKKRKEVPYWSRLISARNDVKLAVSYRLFNLPFACAKYLFVRIFEVK